MNYDILKRLLDIILVIIIAVVFSPVILFIILLIKVTSPGPVLAETPMRVGRNGRLFKLYKFRSMIPNAHKLLKHNPKFKKLYEEYKRSSYKLKDDPRVTPLGKFIRRHSLDELPQLINVLRDDMSLVGPRPYYPDELEEQQKKYPHTRKLVGEVLSVKPGITGLWQVTGRSEINFDERIAIDADYARRKSLFFDMLILVKSPWIMVTGKGAV